MGNSTVRITTKLLTVDEGATECAACPFYEFIQGADACRRYFHILLDIDCKENDMTTIKTTDYGKNGRNLCGAGRSSGSNYTKPKKKRK